MSITLSELAERIGAELRGDGSILVERCLGLEDAGPADVSFLANPRYTRLLPVTKAAAVIVSPKVAADISDRTLLVANDPYFAFREAVVALHGFRDHGVPRISELAFIDPSADIGAECVIEPFVHIGANVKVGDRCVIRAHCTLMEHSTVGNDTILFPHVTIYDHCILGDRVTIHAGCTIGQDGFGYASHSLPEDKGGSGVVEHHKIPQVGNVIVEDDVEMGANCSVDRATIGSTVIGRGSKFSDLVAIGHGARVGEHNLLVAQVGIAGSAETGRYVVMGGQVGVAGHLKIGDGVQLAAKAGVVNDIPAGEQYGGQPAIPLNLAKRAVLASAKLPGMSGTLRKLERRIEKLEAELDKRSG